MCLFYHELSAAADGCYDCHTTFMVLQAHTIATLLAGGSRTAAMLL
jgi:hypothetical protein